MLGFKPLGARPLAYLSRSVGSVTNVYSIPSNFLYHPGNAIASQVFNTPGNYKYFALTGANIITPTGPRHVSWFGIETLHSGHGLAHSSWFGLEVLHTGHGFGHVSLIEIEALHSGHGDIHISNICIEVLRSIRSQDDAEATHVY